MKLRYLYLAIGVLCNASLVSCGDSFKEKTEISCMRNLHKCFNIRSLALTEVQTVDITSEASLGSSSGSGQVVIGLQFLLWKELVMVR